MDGLLFLVKRQLPLAGNKPKPANTLLIIEFKIEEPHGIGAKQEPKLHLFIKADADRPVIADATADMYFWQDNKIAIVYSFPRGNSRPFVAFQPFPRLYPVIVIAEY
jgi:hypothetical protein